MLSTVVFYSLLILVFHLCFSVRFTNENRLGSPYKNQDNINKLKGSLRYKLLSRTSGKNEKKYIKKTKHLDNSVSADGIAHYEIKNNSKYWKKINEIENGFKNMLAMEGVTFIYKRDTFWRTYREVRFGNSSKTQIFYKCTNIITTTCDGCYGGGFWTIDEDRISCPYEIFSMMNKNELCVVNYAQIDKINESCPSVTSLDDFMLSCDNPITTMYRVTKMNTKLSSESERKQTDICGGREYCDVSTFYRINDDYVLFRLLNSSNDVVYSKIMKHNKKNYACINNCGRVNNKNMIVSKSDENGEYQHLNENGKKQQVMNKNDEKQHMNKNGKYQHVTEISKKQHRNKNGQNQHINKNGKNQHENGKIRHVNKNELEVTNSKISSGHQNEIPASCGTSPTQPAGCDQNKFSKLKELLQKLKQAIVENKPSTKTKHINSKQNKNNKTSMSPCQKLRTTTEDYEEGSDYSV